MRVPTSLHPGAGMLARIVKLKQEVILNREYYYFEHRIVSLKIFFTG